MAGRNPDLMTPEDVHAITLERVIDGIVLRWVWPAEITRVSIARQESDSREDWDENPVTWFDYTHTEYLDGGALFLDALGTTAPGRHYRYTVHARKMTEGDGELSPGAAEDCRGVIEWRPWNVFSYQLSTLKSRRPAVLLKWRLQSAQNDFPGFVILASEAGVPEGSHDPNTVELLRLMTPRGGNVTGEVEIYLEKIREKNWPSFYLRAFALDRAAEESTVFEHPNSMIPISPKGVFHSPNRAGSIPVFRPGIPKKVICPHCLRQFPVQDMMFALANDDPTDEKTAPRKGRYGMMRRLLGKPPAPPRDRNGRQFGKRLCFHCDHELPGSAHAQEGLIIGLIGAGNSGKSHFIASLIHRLQSVAGDFAGGLAHLDDPTLAREKAMRETLFEFREPLPQTSGTPNPLLYDLKIGGSVWGDNVERNVTLVLYETAGENLDTQKVAEKMVQYLKVAAGVIFLLDPLELPEVWERVSEKAKTTQRRKKKPADPNTVLGNVLRLLEKGEVIRHGAKLEVPIAVALSKCDYLRDAGIISQQRVWNSRKRHAFYFNRTLSEDISGMFGGMMNRWSPEAYNNIRARFASHAFFGLSATGCAPEMLEDGTEEFPFISPWRVEDPLLWLLAELGVIPSRWEI